MPKSFENDSNWDGSPNGSQQSEFAEGGGGSGDSSDVDQREMDEIVVEGNRSLSDLIARKLHQRIVSKDRMAAAKGRVANRLELSVTEALGSVHLDEDGNEGSGAGGSSLPGVRENQYQARRGGHNPDPDSGSDYDPDPDSDSDSDSDCIDSDEEGELLSVIGQDPSEPILNNGRYEVEASEEVVVHTPESMRRCVRDMRAGEPRAAQSIAAGLLNTKGALDWAVESIEFTEEGDMKDKITNTHHLDFLSVDAMPGANIGGDDRGNISSGKLTFCQWKKPYKSYRALTADHSFYRRTLRVAEIENQEIFIVMKPKPGEILDIDNHGLTASQARKRSAMSRPHAQQLFMYLCNIMMTTQRLSRHGVNKRWRLGGLESADMDRKDWKILYAKMVERWPEFLEACPESYWLHQEITLHIYQIGQDVNIRSMDCTNNTLANNLSRMYDPSAVSTFMYALATNVSIESSTIDDISGATRYETKSTLFDTAEITRDYLDVRGAGLRVFPMAFSPSVCSFQANKAPQSYQSAVIDPINRTLRAQNQILDPNLEVVKVVLFQGYSLLKQYCRHRPKEFLLGLGMYTCTLCAPEKLGKVHTDKQTKFFHSISVGAPFVAFDNALASALANGRIGSRFEPVISVDFQALRAENRTWEYVCEQIIRPTLLWTTLARALYGTWMRLYEPIIFPGILQDMSYIFRTALDGLTALWVKNKKQSGLIAAEAIATLELLAIFMFTGNRAHTPTRVWKYIGLQQNIDTYAWPYILPGRIDLIAIPAAGSRATHWLKDGASTSLILSHLPSIKFHFGEAVAARRATSMSMLSAEEIVSTETATTLLREVIRKFMVPQLREVVLKSLREQHSTISSVSAATTVGSELRELAREEVNARERLLEAFVRSESPFDRQLMLKLVDRFYLRSADQPWKRPTLLFPASELELIQPADLASMIMSWNPEKSRLLAPPTSHYGVLYTPLSLSKKWMSWIDTIFEIMRAGDMLTGKQWVEALRMAIKWESIEIIPGPYNGSLSGRRFTKVLEFTGFRKRAREETPAEAIRGAVKRLRNGVYLPISVPLSEIPGDYESGMLRLLRRYDKSNADPEGVPGAHIAAFLRRAAAALDLDEPSHNLCLLIGYVLSRNSPPPVAACYSRSHPTRFILNEGVKMGTSRNEWYFIFMIRCLMWLCPEVNREEKGHASASVILKVFEHKKVNNRLLEGLKICVRIKGHRLWPKCNELRVNTDEHFTSTMSEAAAASRIGARSVLQMWLPPPMVDRVVALLESEEKEDDF